MDVAGVCGSSGVSPVAWYRTRIVLAAWLTSICTFADAPDPLSGSSVAAYCWPNAAAGGAAAQAAARTG